jgi:hypothetical protein
LQRLAAAVLFHGAVNHIEKVALRWARAFIRRFFLHGDDHRGGKLAKKSRKDRHIREAERIHALVSSSRHATLPTTQVQRSSEQHIAAALKQSVRRDQLWERIKLGTS